MFEAPDPSISILLDIDGSGASNIELTGSVDDLAIEVSGASDAKLYNLTAKGAILKASGASHVGVTVTEILKAVSYTHLTLPTIYSV